MAFNVVRISKELDIISLVDIIFLLLIFALMIQIGGESGKTPIKGKGDKETTLWIDIGRGRVADRPELIQVRVMYDKDTNVVNYPPVGVAGITSCVQPLNPLLVRCTWMRESLQSKNLLNRC